MECNNRRGPTHFHEWILSFMSQKVFASKTNLNLFDHYILRVCMVFTLFSFLLLNHFKQSAEKISLASSDLKCRGSVQGHTFILWYIVRQYLEHRLIYCILKWDCVLKHYGNNLFHKYQYKWIVRMKLVCSSRYKWKKL